jgi:uncharacterized protein (DUF2336 family)
MLLSSESLVAELDSVLSRAPTTKPAAILRGMLDLFVSGAATFSRQHVAIFDDLFIRLIDKVDAELLSVLSQRLASISNPPNKLLDHLSRNDEISIAGPILSQSPALGEETLCEIARTKGQLHLAAVASRPQITEKLTDILVDRGHPDIAHKLACNPGARLSMRGFSKLIKRAETDRTLADALSGRSDLPNELRPFLVLASS